jgi:peptidoglycan/xylan/chitin deacetylase (PgdA/CDA1 family)
MINLRPHLGSVRRKLIGSVYSRAVDLGNCGPIVSFCFDDFPRSAYATGGTILKSFGVQGTYYAAIGLMNTANHLGELFCRDDLASLVADGHELASHTFSHVSCRSVSTPTFLSEVEKGRKAIEYLTGRPDSGNFAFPYGDFTRLARKSLTGQVQSSRSTWRGLNGPKVDLSLLRANSLYGENDQVDDAQQLISENENKRSWLIFYSHDVRSHPSAFGCTPFLLESAVSCAIRRSRVMTIAQALTELYPSTSKLATAVTARA